MENLIRNLSFDVEILYAGGIKTMKKVIKVNKKAGFAVGISVIALGGVLYLAKKVKKLEEKCYLFDENAKNDEKIDENDDEFLE